MSRRPARAGENSLPRECERSRRHPPPPSLRYANIVAHCETPGTRLHEAWADLPAPPIARAYWQMAPDATWVDTLRRMLADEAHHRDINHAYASLPPGDLRDNPFAEEHMHDFDRAVRRRAEHVLNEALRATRAGETPSAT